MYGGSHELGIVILTSTRRTIGAAGLGRFCSYSGWTMQIPPSRVHFGLGTAANAGSSRFPCFPNLPSRIIESAEPNNHVISNPDGVAASCPLSSRLEEFMLPDLPTRHWKTSLSRFCIARYVRTAIGLRPCQFEAKLSDMLDYLHGFGP